MSLGPGTRIGPYEIVAPLGAGGMGEVWRARDVRLEREAPMIDRARFRMFREVKIESGLPEGTDLR